VVHIYGSDQATLDAIDKAAERHDTEFEYVKGKGEFIGTQAQSGSEREQRDDARRIYEDTISEIAAKSPRRNIKAHWHRIRDRWQPQLPLAKTYPYKAREVHEDEAAEERGQKNDKGSY
jgi:hypothetical protein